jgi:hypothetical protein
MRKFLLFLFFLISLSFQAQTLQQKFLFDFGRHDTTNGETRVSPDKNGNYWNNIGNITLNASVSALKNTANTSTGLALTITGSGFDYNGLLNGGLRTPYATQFAGR